ncbi:RNA-binding protein [Candidatus Pacearchaeota archaeon]|jgi:exosome complex component RRP4|nr:RNA-binding protein [Candidatus Pacearchaeota archaeon]|tara:strand:- start:396 stop:1136 length:741 start_codon:yes stop_codon:yes gene_type:complete
MEEEKIIEENKEEQEKGSEEMDNDNSQEEIKVERKLVIPGETIVSGDDYLPGDYTKKDGDNVVSNRYGLAEVRGRVVKILPISGVYEPRRGNTVIGRVSEINFSGWQIDIGGPWRAFLPLNECPRFINRNNVAEFAGVGDVFNIKVWGVKQGSVDLSLKSRGLGKLEDGRIIKINCHKVPRVIGKEGSMINLIKDKTSTEITVGQNGYVWLKGDIDGTRKAEEAIRLIEKEAASEGLTNKVEEFLG